MKLTDEQKTQIIEMKLRGVCTADIRDTLEVSTDHIARTWAGYRKDHPAVSARPTANSRKAIKK